MQSFVRDLECLLLLTIGDDEFLGSAGDESHSDDDRMKVIFNGHLALLRLLMFQKSWVITTTWHV